jgi:hypothetical protein
LTVTKVHDIIRNTELQKFTKESEVTKILKKFLKEYGITFIVSFTTGFVVSLIMFWVLEKLGY